MRPAASPAWLGAERSRPDFWPDRHDSGDDAEPGYGENNDYPAVPDHQDGADGAAEAEGADGAAQDGPAEADDDRGAAAGPGWRIAARSTMDGSAASEGPYRPWFAAGGPAEPWFAVGSDDMLAGPG